MCSELGFAQRAYALSCCAGCIYYRNSLLPLSFSLSIHTHTHTHTRNKMHFKTLPLPFEVRVCVCVCVYWFVSVMSNPFATLWIVAHQAPLSMEFCRQEYWSGLPFPPPGGSFLPRDWTCVSYVSSIGRRVHQRPRGSPLSLCTSTQTCEMQASQAWQGKCRRREPSFTVSCDAGVVGAEPWASPGTAGGTPAGLARAVAAECWGSFCDAMLRQRPSQPSRWKDTWYFTVLGSESRGLRGRRETPCFLVYWTLSFPSCHRSLRKRSWIS